MILAMAVMAGVECLAKVLGQDVPVPMIVWARYAFVLPVLIAVNFGRLQSLVRSGPVNGQIIRASLPLLGSYFIIGAYGFMPLADAVAVMFASQFLVVVLAIPVLKERIGYVRWIGVVLGFVGITVVLKPSPSMDWATLLPLVTALVFAVYQIMTRTISRTASPMSMLFYLALVGTIGGSLSQIEKHRSEEHTSELQSHC